MSGIYLIEFNLPLMRKLLFFFLVAIFTLQSCQKDEEMDVRTFSNYFLKSEPTFTLNPNGNTPLVAVAEMEFRNSGNFTITIEGEDPYTTQGAFNEGVNKLPIKGLYTDKENTVHISLNDGSVKADTSIKLTTEKVPDYFPGITIKKNLSTSDKRWTLCGFSVGNNGAYNSYPFIVDGNGAIRWYADFHYDHLIFPIKLTSEGLLMVPYKNNIYFYNYMGKLIHSFNIGEYAQHHEIFQNDEGNYVIAVDKPSAQRVEDIIIEVDNNGTVLNKWDMQEILDVDRDDIGYSGNDWFHMNAIYPEKDGSFLISGRNQGVVKTSETNELQWILAPHKGWGKAGPDGNGFETSDYLLTAVNSDGEPYNENVQLGTEKAEDFDWAWGQHAVMRLENGNIMLFDNGHRRRFGNSPDYSRAVEYAVDEENKTIEQIWSYGESRGSSFYSTIISDVDELPTGNILVSSGYVPSRGATIVEVEKPGKKEVFELKLNFKDLKGGGQGWGQSDIMYRAEKVDF